MLLWLMGQSITSYILMANVSLATFLMGHLLLEMELNIQSDLELEMLGATFPVVSMNILPCRHTFGTNTYSKLMLCKPVIIQLNVDCNVNYRQVNVISFAQALENVTLEGIHTGLLELCLTILCH